MNPIFIATFLCMGALVSGNPLLLNNGQWRGEGLLESQDWAGALGGPVGVWDAPGVLAARAGVLGAPLGTWGLGGRLVDNSGLGWANQLGGVAWNNAGLGWASPLNSWAHGGAPIGIDGRVVDTPAVAIAKAEHAAAKINTVVESSLINHGGW